MNLRNTLFLLLTLGLSLGEVKAGGNDDVVLNELKKTKEKLEGIIVGRPEFKLTEVPEQWKDESAVILYKFLLYEAEKTYNSNYSSTEYAVKVYSKYRIKLQDNFAVNDFSEFYFGNRDLLEIKVIKADGTEYEVDMKEAKSSDTKFDDFLGLSGLSLTIDSYKKLPVPNLNKGDIIELTLVSENLGSYDRKIYHQPYIPTLEARSLAGSFPVMHQFIEFHLTYPFKLNFKSLNGAPEIQPIKVDKEKASFIFHDSMRARSKPEYWSGGLGFNPSIKYVVNRQINSKEGLDFINNNMKVKSEVKKKEIVKLANFVYTDKMNSSSGIYFDFIKRNRGKIKNPNEYVERFYYYYRARVFAPDRSKGFSNAQFVMNLSRVLKKRAIEFDYLVAVPLTFGGLENVISNDELVWAISLKDSKKIYSEFDVYSNPNDMNQHLLGHEIFSIEPAKNLKKMRIKKVTLPPHDPSENRMFFSMSLNFDQDLNTVNLSRKTEATGYAKNRYKSLVPMESYHQEKEQNGMGKTEFGVPNVFYKEDVAFDRDFLENESDRIESAVKSNQDKGFKSFVESELRGDGLNVKVVKSVIVNSDGRTPGQPILAFDDQSVVDEVCHKSDKYVIFDLGKFLGGQFELTDSEDQERNQDIYFGYTREFSYDLVVTVPDGYSVSGLESFNRSVDNSTGSFTVSAVLQGNQITVKSSKKYKGIQFSKDQWEDVKAFINLASEVSHSKIILTKND